MIKPRTKPRKSSKERVEAKHKARSRRARAADASATARSTFSTSNRDGLGRWLKDPHRFDVSGVDTKGKGKSRPEAKSAKKSNRKS